MKWETGYDESVEVNQRALIDKVLARYSGEFTVFRELLQNSDDAQSKTVEIRFQTQDFLDGEHTTGSGGRETLPDLKTTSASILSSFVQHLLNGDRYINGSSGTMGSPSGTKIGVALRGLVRPFRATR